MPDTSAEFSGSMPEKFDRHLGPVLFEPFAVDFAGRIDLPEGARLLELACGSGILTRHLRERLPATVRIVATDSNEAMVEYARARLRPEGNIEWRQAEAAALPFADASFDAVVCQFGLTFFPDRDAALREVRRVLAARGVLLFSVWDDLVYNDLARIADAVVRDLVPDDPPRLWHEADGLSDPDRIHTLLERNGFADVHVRHVSFVGTSESSRHVAIGLIEGTPAARELARRGTAGVGAIVAAVDEAIARECGERPVRARMRALFVRGIRPA